jgi:aryl-alcohol dehydrogenase-like predicted oxidoreductase
MEYTELRDTGIKVSKICIGGMSFGEAFEDFHL